MALLDLVYNATSGSDTAASGAGPASAVTGTTATVNGGDPGTLIDLDGTPDLSGVAVSDVIWLNISGANRNLHRITAVDDGADTVTIEDAVSLGAGVSWAIGGKRKTLNNNTSRRDWEDYKPGWEAELEAGTYDTPVTILTAAGDKTSGPIKVKAAAAASPIVNTTANIDHFDFRNNGLHLIGLTITTTSGTKTSTQLGTAGAGGSDYLIVRDCVIDGLQNVMVVNFDSNVVWINTEMKNCVGAAISIPFNTRPVHYFFGCNIHDNGGDGILATVTSAQAKIFVNWCIFSNNTGDGINWHLDGGMLLVSNSTFHGNVDGIDLNDTMDAESHVTILNSIFDSNSGFGINGVTDVDFSIGLADFNAFRNNTSGARNNISAGANDVTLSADPFTDQANDDYSLNTTAGGGAACRAAGFPGAFPSGNSTGFIDIGAVQHADPAGGGGGLLVHPGMTGGMHG